jgi:sodium/potassium-transporting ATPase subunit alpha
MNITDCLIGRKALSANSAVAIMELDSNVTDPDISRDSIVDLATVSGLCNAGEFDAATLHLPLARRKIFGDATDSAILRFSESIHPVSESRKAWITTYKVPFNSKNKFMIHIIQMATTAQEERNSNLILTIKGAPDILLPRCTHFTSGQGGSEPLTDDHRKMVEDIKDNWSKQAKRVILVARKNLSEKVSAMSKESTEFDDEVLRQASYGLELIGLLAIVDPPRDEIPEVIRTLRGAGVKVHMVTGDFKLTAQAIAVECGIITLPPENVHDISALQGQKSLVDNPARSIVLSGPDMMALSDDQWDTLCKYDEIVFARTTPEQKLRIVKELQARGEVVGSE